MRSIGELFGMAVFALVFIFGALALPKALFELKYYQTVGWDFNKDSGRKMWKQDEFRARFYSKPIGVIKLRVLLTRVAIAVWIAFEFVIRLPS